MEADNIYANRYHDTTLRFQGFFKLIAVWKGSVMKLIWHDLAMFVFLYAVMSIIYRTLLFEHEVMREMFECLCVYASKFQAKIPITFLTGFYVTQVVARYWDQFMSLPWPDRIAFKLVSYVPGKSTYHRTLRRTVMRYVNLSTVLVFRLVAAKVHARFPNYQSLVKAKILLPHEARRLELVDDRTPHETTYIPILWALNLIQKARTDGQIKVEPPVYANLISAFDYLESCNRKIFNHGWVNFPLAYTQVATMGVFAYFFASLFGCQYLIPNENTEDTEIFPHLNISYSNQSPMDLHTPDIYIPFFTILEFISYFGWIKVAETLLNPFGDDDEDFQINYLIDRNFQVSYLIVDEAMHDLDMAPDPFLNHGGEIPPSELPYREDEEDVLPITKKTRNMCCNVVSSIPGLRTLAKRVKYRRAHRCQSTRSRLRSLNENRRSKAIHPRGSRINRRVHRMSEVSAPESFGNSDFGVRFATGIEDADGRQYNRSVSNGTVASHKKEVQFDFSNRSFEEDLNDNEYVV